MKAFVPDIILRTLQTYGNKAAEKVASVVIENQEGVAELNHAVYSGGKRIKNAAIKTLRLVSEDAPELMYRYFEFYTRYLGHKDHILAWNCTYIIVNLAVVDEENMIDDTVVRTLLKQLEDEELVAAANTASCIWKIAKYKPEFRSLVIQKLIKVDQKERNEECKAILSGKAILSLNEIWDLIENKKQVLKFVQKHLKSQRKATAKKAEQFMRKHPVTA